MAVGSELLRPGFRETHSEWITPRLEGAGFEVIARMVASDATDAIVKTLDHARALAPLVLVSGGIGPTQDDRTRAALALSTGRRLVRDGAAEAQIRRWCRRHRFPVTAAQLQQSLLPEGALSVRNDVGSAPGVWLALEKRLVVVLPGVPAEMRAMLEHLLPRLAKLSRSRVVTRTLRCAGLGETRVDRRIQSLQGAFPKIEITTLASPGEVTIQLRARGREGRRRVQRLAQRIAQRLGADLVSSRGESLEQVVLDLLKARGWQLSVAESCTAGLVAARLTRMPGSSQVFWGGAVCYNDRAKTRMLSVPAALIARHGAVSRAVALAMARGALKTFQTQLAVAVTGIAGPGGGSSRKPVGTVHWAVAFPGGETTLRKILAGDREKIRAHAACIALDRVRRVLLQPRRSGRRS